MRLTRKPGASWTTTGVFPRVLASAKIVATVSSVVRLPRMTSTSGIRCTGLKKCIPATRPGSTAPTPISVIGNVDVLDAKMAVRGTFSSHSRSTARLTASFSTTASIVTSHRRNPE